MIEAVQFTTWRVRKDLMVLAYLIPASIGDPLETRTALKTKSSPKSSALQRGRNTARFLNSVD